MVEERLLRMNPDRTVVYRTPAWWYVTRPSIRLGGTPIYTIPLPPYVRHRAKADQKQAKTPTHPGDDSQMHMYPSDLRNRTGRLAETNVQQAHPLRGEPRDAIPPKTLVKTVCSYRLPRPLRWGRVSEGRQGAVQGGERRPTCNVFRACRESARVG